MESGTDSGFSRSSQCGESCGSLNFRILSSLNFTSPDWVLQHQIVGKMVKLTGELSADSLGRQVVKEILGEIRDSSHERISERMRADNRWARFA